MYLYHKVLHTSHTPTLILHLNDIDKPGVEGSLVTGIARRFQFSSGEKILVREETNRGLMAAWRHAWSWKDRELFVIIEDDVEMSPHWYRALVNMWTKYGDR